jgi:DNA-binding protein HU-beta
MTCNGGAKALWYVQSRGTAGEISINKKGSIMNKAQLVERIAAEADISKAAASAALEAFTNAVKGSLQSGEDVALVGFGTFTVKDRAARKGRNPQTGETIDIKAAKVVGFKPGKALKDSINN